MEPKFSARNGGFQITFENGLTLSTQFGAGNYCDNYNLGDFGREKPCDCKNAEIEVIDASGEFVTDQILKTGDDVEGRVTVSDWLQYIKIVSDYKK